MAIVLWVENVNWVKEFDISNVGISKFHYLFELSNQKKLKEHLKLEYS